MNALLKKLSSKVWLVALIALLVSAVTVYKPLAAPTTGNYYAVGYDYPTGTYHYCALRVYANFQNGVIKEITDHSYVSDLIFKQTSEPQRVLPTSAKGSYSGVGSSMITYSGIVYVNFN